MAYEAGVSATAFTAHVERNRPLGAGYFVLEFAATCETGVADVVPGQFAMVRGDWGRDLLNPRAFSVFEAADSRHFSILGKVFGRGTKRLAAAVPGEKMTILAPLGVGFRPARAGVTQLLVAGGVGLPPLHLQAKRNAAAVGPNAVEVFYGGRTRDDLLLLEDFEAWGVKTHLATEDGSLGTRGYVTKPLVSRVREAAQRGESVELLACGPTGMLQAVRKLGLDHGVPTQLCLEEHMACGFGVCLGCAVPVYGEKPYRYCCSDGPVFDAQEVRWS